MEFFDFKLKIPKKRDCNSIIGKKLAKVKNLKF